MKVLIVDDSAHALAIAKARLTQEGLEVVCADSGQTGLEAAAREKPDLILLDIDMPGLSGFDVCRKLKADPQLRTIPVIFLTAVAGAEQKVRGLDLGATDYVTKPFDAFELRARVRAALRTKHLQDLLNEHAHVDPLTGLPNRRAIMECLQREWARIQRHGGLFSLIMADVDRFKHINDTYGHNVGDRVLQEVANAIAGRCRKVDLAGRYGGDEFAVVAPGGAAADVLPLAQRCGWAIEQIRINVVETVVTTTASLGVADSANVGSVKDLIERADAALYSAKNAGGNTVQCENPPSCVAAALRLRP
ncbi:MAG: diguanylate cyclase [Phycisphaerae bacterium]|nr:diguanylate cyclase [Phycisphaerae bacterium]